MGRLSQGEDPVHMIITKFISDQPPTPPPGTNLRVTHWNGEPIAFDDQVMFVCEKGCYFEVQTTLTSLKHQTLLLILMFTG